MFIMNNQSNKNVYYKFTLLGATHGVTDMVLIVSSDHKRAPADEYHTQWLRYILSMDRSWRLLMARIGVDVLKYLGT